jgi:hypothetical protein
MNVVAERAVSDSSSQSGSQAKSQLISSDHTHGSAGILFYMYPTPHHMHWTKIFGTTDLATLYTTYYRPTRYLE